MAEFQEVMKQWRRMCNKHQCADKKCGAVAYDLICPITISHNGYPCGSCFVDCSPESMAQVEQIVMEWAAEHPEPVYPTWYTWLIMMGAVGSVEDLFSDLQRPIPADIAERLGIEPKKDKDGNNVVVNPTGEV